MSILKKGSYYEKLRFTINEEISVFVNYVQEKVLETKEAKDLVINTIVPRLTKLREIVTEYELQEKTKEQTGTSI
jgi:hypothetical protein